MKSDLKFKWEEWVPVWYGLASLGPIWLGIIRYEVEFYFHVDCGVLGLIASVWTLMACGPCGLAAILKGRSYAWNMPRIYALGLGILGIFLFVFTCLISPGCLYVD